MANGRLAGLRILVTRPAHQAANLCRLIEAAGGEPVTYPTLAIRAARDPEAARRRLAGEYDLAVFVSANAVAFGFELLESGRLPAKRVAAVGKGTAAELQRRGRAPDWVPEGRGDSESLLALPELAEMDGHKVLIVRGSGGRERLAETLRERGATVDYAEVYRRALPEADPDSDPTAVDVITASSSEALLNLERLAGTARHERLHRLPLAVFHPRIAERARRNGFSGPIMVAREPGDAALIAAIADWATDNQQG